MILGQNVVIAFSTLTYHISKTIQDSIDILYIVGIDIQNAIYWCYFRSVPVSSNGPKTGSKLKTWENVCSLQNSMKIFGFWIIL
jgi:hypothetical protein